MWGPAAASLHHDLGWTKIATKVKGEKGRAADDDVIENKENLFFTRKAGDAIYKWRLFIKCLILKKITGYFSLFL